MSERDQGRPLAGEELSGQVWMPVKHAARAAGVPERSAFRWARKGAIEVRRSGKVQLVEVAALRAYAARPVNGKVAEGGAGAAGGATVAAGTRGSPRLNEPAVAAAAKVAEVAAIADWDERRARWRLSWRSCISGWRRWRRTGAPADPPHRGEPARSRHDPPDD